MTGTELVYITTADKAEAKKIAAILVEERLAACANVMDNMESIYRWQGKIEQGREAVLILKTTAALVPELIERIKALHSYDCPCIISLPITDGNKAFLDWINKETR
jgi:periplasmic divalent cation tolerance protein